MKLGLKTRHVDLFGRIGRVNGQKKRLINNMEETMNAKQKPVYETKMRQIRAAVFENEGKDGNPFYSTQLVRRYKSGDDEWTNSSNFTGEADLVLARQLIDDVLVYLRRQSQFAQDNK